MRGIDLKRARTDRGVMQAFMAKMLGISYQSQVRLEKKEEAIALTWIQWQAVKRVLNMTDEELGRYE